jgi:hypothetical protein
LRQFSTLSEMKAQTSTPQLRIDFEERLCG